MGQALGGAVVNPNSADIVLTSQGWACMPRGTSKTNTRLISLDHDLDTTGIGRSGVHNWSIHVPDLQATSGVFNRLLRTKPRDQAKLD